MSRTALEIAARASGGRVNAALIARYRDFDLAEEAYAEACLRAAKTWPLSGEPRDAAAWLFSVADRVALDMLRRRKTREKFLPDEEEPALTAEDIMTQEPQLIPDERLRLIFVCCHPALGPDARIALTLRMVCGLATEEIARAFLVSEITMAQRLVRAKQKIAMAEIPFEVPARSEWDERLESILATLEVAYSSAHSDAAGTGSHAGFATEILDLTRDLVALLPQEAEALSLAAIVRFTEARRPARLDLSGAMVPLSEQDPSVWRRPLIEEAESYLLRAAALQPSGTRSLQAAIHAAWCARRSKADPHPWQVVLELYDALLTLRDDPIIRINRAVALAEIAGAKIALVEIDMLKGEALANFPPYHAVRADLLARIGRNAEAKHAFAQLLALPIPSAERLWLERRRLALAT